MSFSVFVQSNMNLKHEVRSMANFIQEQCEHTCTINQTINQNQSYAVEN